MRRKHGLVVSVLATSTQMPRHWAQLLRQHLQQARYVPAEGHTNLRCFAGLAQAQLKADNHEEEGTYTRSIRGIEQSDRNSKASGRQREQRHLAAERRSDEVCCTNRPQTPMSDLVSSKNPSRVGAHSSLKDMVNAAYESMKKIRKQSEITQRRQMDANGKDRGSLSYPLTERGDTLDPTEFEEMGNGIDRRHRNYESSKQSRMYDLVVDDRRDQKVKGVGHQKFGMESGSTARDKRRTAASQELRHRDGKVDEEDKVAERWAAKLNAQLTKKAEGHEALFQDATLGDSSCAATKQSEQQQPQQQREEAEQRVRVQKDMSLRALASVLGVGTSKLEQFLTQLGEEIKSSEDHVSLELAELAALEYGKVAVYFRTESPGSHLPRTPVITVMGHVDHGKTSLLDLLRKTRLASEEAGGITQHIGAFEVSLPESGRALTFLDTPGHAAFTAMRARGAAVTDIAVLAVAADDGVMPQTREALQHCRSAGCPVVIAMTKCDLPQARPDEVKRQLLAEGIELEDMGGSVQLVETSSRSGKGLKDLEEALILEAENMQLMSNYESKAEGVIIEARMDKGLGPVATVIIQSGSLNVGDAILVGTEHGKVKAMTNSTGSCLERVFPGQHALLSGLKGLPLAGDELVVMASEDSAQRISEARSARADDFRRAKLSAELYEANERKRQELLKGYVERREHRLFRKSLLNHHKRHLIKKVRSIDAVRAAAARNAKDEKVQMDELSKKDGGLQLSLIIKADVQGSAEVIRQTIQGLSSDQYGVHNSLLLRSSTPSGYKTEMLLNAKKENKFLILPKWLVNARIVSESLGPVNISDVNTAIATGSSIVAFNLKPTANELLSLTKQKGVCVMNHNVIYRLIDEISQKMSALVPKEQEPRVVGRAEILQTFPLLQKAKVCGTVLGCKVNSGLLKREGARFQLLRNGKVLMDSSCTSLRKQKRDVDSVGVNNECGLVLSESCQDGILPGDVVVCLET